MIISLLSFFIFAIIIIFLYIYSARYSILVIFFYFFYFFSFFFFLFFYFYHFTRSCIAESAVGSSASSLAELKLKRTFSYSNAATFYLFCFLLPTAPYPTSALAYSSSVLYIFFFYCSFHVGLYFFKRKFWGM